MCLLVLGVHQPLADTKLVSKTGTTISCWESQSVIIVCLWACHNVCM